MKRTSKFISLFLAIVLCLSILPVSVSAASGVKITQKGQVVDSITFNGVTVNAIYAPRATVSNYGSDTTYCCAAFVSKFYRQVYGVTVYNLVKNGGGPKASSGSFSKTTTPQVGDIVHKKTATVTHWAIVKAVSGNTVTIIEQNGWYDKGNDVARVGKTVTIGDRDWTFYRYSGVDTSVSVTTDRVENLGQTEATLYGAVSSPGCVASEIGIYLGTSADSLTKLGSDAPKGSTPAMWYNTEKYGYTLTPGTTYYYQAYAIVSGETYWGDIASFTTPPKESGQYTVTLKNDGSADKQIMVTNGATYKNLPTPAKSGYTFSGWYTAESGGTQITSSTTVNLTEDQTLYAQWKETQLIADGIYTLTPKCATSARLDVDNGGMTNKTNIQIYKANNTASQKFEITYIGNGYYTIRSVRSDKMVDVANGGTTSKTNVWQYTANDSASQHWKFVDAGDGYYYIVPELNNNLALDVCNGSSANKTNVWIYTKNNSDAQKWKLTATS